MCQFFFMGVTVILICIEVFLLQNSLEEILINFTLLIAGVASRVAIGFSPSIFVSGNRTCAVMSYCIIAVVICIIVNCTEEVDGNQSKSVLICNKAKIFYVGLIGLAILNFWCHVMTKFVK